jgi:LL-diaminopimelate aminotransferase
MEVAHRLQGIGEYYFSQKLREIDALNKAGKNIINLGIGSPDIPPNPTVIEVLQNETARLDVHAYQSYKGSPILRHAISEWYQTWYNVSLDPNTEILPLLGSKEGIMHICMTYLNPGDEVLIPNPGYPTYTSAVKLAGGTPVYYDLLEENDWQPNFAELAQRPQNKVKLIFVNYPHMPTGQLPTLALFQQLIAFAKQHDILIVHDNPYSFTLNDAPLSILSLPGAKQVAIELNSLSKSHNMAGWRVGMLCGAKEHIDAVLTFKSNMDSGMFLPIQLAAAMALSLDQYWYKRINDEYRHKRVSVFALLSALSCKFSKNQAGMFVWAKVPDKYIANPAAQKHPLGAGGILSDEVLQNNNVFITPGGIFGSNGLHYVRVSLCNTLENLQQAVNSVSNFYFKEQE